jgi:hypothetical protein
MNPCLRQTWSATDLALSGIRNHPARIRAARSPDILLLWLRDRYFHVREFARCTSREAISRSHFSCGAPVHARSGDPQVDFIDVIGINVGGGQSPSMSDIDLLVDINPGRVEFNHENRTYELSLRCFRIILEKNNNAMVQPGTYYKAVLQQGTIVVSDSTRYQRASALQDLGRHGEALNEIEASMPLYVEVRGAQDWWTLVLRSLKISVFMECKQELDGRHEQALRDIVDGLQHQLGPHRLQTLRSRYRLARLLLARGNRRDAQAEVLTILANIDKSTVPEHDLLRRARQLAAMIEEAGSDDDLKPRPS